MFGGVALAQCAGRPSPRSTTSGGSPFARRRGRSSSTRPRRGSSASFPFDGACWHTLDPGSDLITQHRLQDLPDRVPVLAENEYAVADVNKFAALARAPRKAATMTEATGGRPERSPRFRNLLTPAGIGS